MGLLDDAIREHLELKKRHGASEEEVTRLESEVFGPGRLPPQAPPPRPAEEEDEAPAAEEPPAEPAAEEPAAPALDEEPPTVAAPPPAAEPDDHDATEEHEPPESPRAEAPAPAREEPEPWLDDPDEVPAEEALDHGAQPPPAGEEDVLEETPEFLQETPDHERLWFEQKPPRDFDFGN